jgi:aspartyl-tRNA(Asn)/glutamyl-tRNA(Gln) amidotransferase subunit A
MHNETAHTLHTAFVKGDLSAESITAHFLARIDAHNEAIGAFLHIDREGALETASSLDNARRLGKQLGPLAGVPIAVKDNILVKGLPATAASKMLENYIAPYDATVVTAIKEAGGIILGKTNMDEFAMGSSNEYSAFYKVHNPWRRGYTPGGSSGGSAAAVAARLAPLSLGTDTGGSIRQPAAFTGIVGYKPTYGRVSRHGLIAFGSSLDVVGPFANSVADIAYSMEMLAGHCKDDSTSNPMGKEPFRDLLEEGDLKGKRIGVPFAFLADEQGEVSANFELFLERVRKQGAEIVDVDLSVMAHGIPIYYIVATAEASTNLARFDGVKYGYRAPATTLIDLYDKSRDEGFGEEVKKRILLGTYVLSSGHKDELYQKAQRVRTLIIRAFTKAFAECDAVAMPTTPSPSFPFGSIQDGITMYKQDLYTVAANLAGVPAISIPSGLTSDGLPLGVQLFAPQLEDARLLRIAHLLESPLPPPPDEAFS